MNRETKILLVSSAALLAGFAIVVYNKKKSEKTLNMSGNTNAPSPMLTSFKDLKCNADEELVKVQPECLYQPCPPMQFCRKK